MSIANMSHLKTNSSGKIISRDYFSKDYLKKERKY